MPITAKLSREFYERFGDDLVDELVGLLNLVDTTYRSELREQNELNFARFDAKLDQRIAQLDAKLDQRIAQLDAKLELRVTQLDAKFDKRFAELETLIHSELRTHTKFVVGLMIVLWTSLLVPIIGLWTR